MILYFGKSAVNPLIYGWKNRDFRVAFARLLRYVPCKWAVDLSLDSVDMVGTTGSRAGSIQHTVARRSQIYQLELPPIECPINSCESSTPNNNSHHHHRQQQQLDYHEQQQQQQHQLVSSSLAMIQHEEVTDL